MPVTLVKKVVPIVFCANNNYLPFMATAIQSVMENAVKDNYVYYIYILHTDITIRNKKLLEVQVKSFPDFSIIFIDVTDYIKGRIFKNLNYSIVVYFRFLIPYILQEYEKVIYLDCDIVCRASISELFEYNINDHLLGCIRDSGIAAQGKKHAQTIGIKDSRNYFNSGVLLFNTKAFQDAIQQDELFKTAASQEYPYPDQDILNVVCEDNIMFLPMQWNNMSSENNTHLQKKLKIEYNYARKNPSIVHYVWDKPWKLFGITERTALFWEYARKIPFVDIIYSRLKEIEITSVAHHHQIYDDIKNGRNYGLKFIVKCGLLWMLHKCGKK